MRLGSCQLPALQVPDDEIENGPLKGKARIDLNTHAMRTFYNKGGHTMGVFTKVVVVLFLWVSAQMTPTSTVAAAWQDELARVTKAAKEEGELRVFSGSSSKLQIPGFQKAFPFLKVRFLQLRAPDIAVRLPTEQRAGRFTWDIILIGGSGGADKTIPTSHFSDLRKFFINPEITRDETWVGDFDDLWVDDESKRFKFQHRGASAKGAVFWVNRKALPESKFNKPDDFFKRELRGKVCAWDPRREGPSDNSFAQVMAMFGDEFLRRLFTETKMVISRSGTKLKKDLINGTYHVCMGTSMTPFHREGVGRHVQKFVVGKEGLDPKYGWLPIVCCGEGKKKTIRDGWMSGGSAYTRLQVGMNPPHPNAAKVFVNWLLSKEGAKAWIDPSDSTCSLRKDLHHSFCTDFLNKDVPDQFTPVDEGGAYLDASKTTTVQTRYRVRQIAIEVFGR